MTAEYKAGQVSFVAADPMAFVEATGGAGAQSPTEAQQEVIGALGAAMKAYVNTAKSLLNGRLSHLKALAPSHLERPGNVLVAACDEGVVIRFETQVGAASKMFVGWMPHTLHEVASILSQRLVHIRRSPEDTPDPEGPGTNVTIGTTDTLTGQTSTWATARVLFDVTIPDASRNAGRSRPFRLLSVRNNLGVQLVGEVLSTDDVRRSPQPFLARSLLRLPVGWDCIEVFPGLAASLWNPDLAEAWAEADILAAVVERQVEEAHLNNLDPNVGARRQMSVLLDEYGKLLASNPPEEFLQRFLSEHPVLLCPAFIHAWPKLGLGAHVTDFVFREAAGDYLLVELEKPSDPLFTRSGHPSSQLTRARGQIQDWRRYLEDNLRSVQAELGLTDISSNPRALVVIGRSSALSGTNRRKLVAIENESPRTKILTYDDVRDNARAVAENLLGPLWELHGNTQVYFLPPGAVGVA